MSRIRWPWVQRAAVTQGTPGKKVPKPADGYWLGEMLQIVLAWLLPSSAVVVAALGQLALAVVLGVIACGIWLRLWRGRMRRRKA